MATTQINLVGDASNGHTTCTAQSIAVPYGKKWTVTSISCDYASTIPGGTKGYLYGNTRNFKISVKKDGEASNIAVTNSVNRFTQEDDPRPSLSFSSFSPIDFLAGTTFLATGSADYGGLFGLITITITYTESNAAVRPQVLQGSTITQSAMAALKAYIQAINSGANPTTTVQSDTITAAVGNTYFTTPGQNNPITAAWYNGT